MRPPSSKLAQWVLLVFIISTRFCARLQASEGPAVVRLSVIDGKDLRFTRMSSADGLSQTRVAQIVQDDLGFMWFGTQYGLNRYDGYKFKVFVHDPRNPNSLGGVFITALFKDRKGRLWVGAGQTLDRFDPATETFKHYSVGGEDSEGLGGAVVNISEDCNGMLWLATGTGLHRFDPGTAEVLHYRHRPGDPTSLSSSDVKSSGEDRAGTFWVGTSEGLDAFDRKTGKVTLHVPVPAPVQISFFEDRFGVFWIINASGNGLAVLDRKTNKLTQYSFYGQDPPDSALTGVMGMLEDRRGNLWFGSPEAGLLKLDRENNRFIRYRNNAADPESLAEDKVIALFEDHEGNIWTGLHSMAPNHFVQARPLFERFQLDPGNPKGLDMTFVNAIYEDRQGILWIGNDSGLHRLDRTTGEYTHWKSGLGVKPMIITITGDSGGVLWIGTYGHGLARFDPETGQFEVFQHRPDDPFSLSNDEVHRVLFDHAGTLWIGTDDGLNRFDPATGRFQVYKLDWQSRRSQSYVAMAEDPAGTLWLGTHYSGLHHFNPKTGGFTVYKSEPNIPGTLLDNMVPAVLIDTAGKIWVGTQLGLNQLDPLTGKFTAYGQTKDVPGHTVTALLEDNQGRLWFSSNLGISCFDPAKSSFRDYTVFDGLPGSDFTGWGTGFKSSSGELFFGGFAGGVAFHPERMVDSTDVPPIVLTDFRSADPPLLTKTGSPPANSVTFTRSMTLSQPQNSFSVEFSALSYSNPIANRYRYRLEGLDQDWIETSSERRQASYTTLPIGSYTFRVQGATARGPWSDPGASLQIEIRPAWWQTWWIRAFLILLMIAGIFFAYRGRIANIRAQEREFRKLAENSPDMVMRFDSGLRYTYVNLRFAEWLGLTPDAILGKTNEESGILEEVPAFAAELRNVLRTCVPATHEFFLKTSATTYLIEARLIPEASTYGIVRSVLVIMRDITDRKRAEEQLRRNEADLRKAQASLAHAARVTTVGELAASIAHEVNQPMAAVVTSANACLRWLDRDSPNLQEACDAVRRIIRDGNRGSEVIARIRALLKKEQTPRERLDVNNVIRDIVALAESNLQGTTLQLSLAGELPFVSGDRVQLQQVLLNLMMNAVDAMKAITDRPRVLRILTRIFKERAVLVAVEDSGVGLSPEQMIQPFEAFHTSKPDGLGLGLSISRSVIEAHGGNLWVEANQGPGVTFQFTLPVEGGGPV